MMPSARGFCLFLSSGALPAFVLLFSKSLHKITHRPLSDPPKNRVLTHWGGGTIVRLEGVLEGKIVRLGEVLGGLNYNIRFSFQFRFKYGQSPFQFMVYIWGATPI
jgi:hypothetical protein